MTEINVIIESDKAPEFSVLSTKERAIIFERIRAQNSLIDFPTIWSFSELIEEEFNLQNDNILPNMPQLILRKLIAQENKIFKQNLITPIILCSKSKAETLQLKKDIPDKTYQNKIESTKLGGASIYDLVTETRTKYTRTTQFPSDFTAVPFALPKSLHDNPLFYNLRFDFPIKTKATLKRTVASLNDLNYKPPLLNFIASTAQDLTIIAYQKNKNFTVNIIALPKLLMPIITSDNFGIRIKKEKKRSDKSVLFDCNNVRHYEQYKIAQYISLGLYSPKKYVCDFTSLLVGPLQIIDEQRIIFADMKRGEVYSNLAAMFQKMRDLFNYYWRDSRSFLLAQLSYLGQYISEFYKDAAHFNKKALDSEPLLTEQSITGKNFWITPKYIIFPNSKFLQIINAHFDFSFSPIFISAVYNDMFMNDFESIYQLLEKYGIDSKETHQYFDRTNKLRQQIKIKKEKDAQKIAQQNKIKNIKSIINKRFGTVYLGEIERAARLNIEAQFNADKYLSLLTEKRREIVKLELEQIKRYFDSIVNNKCPHVQIYHKLRRDRRIVDMRRDLKEIENYFNPGDDKNSAMIKCKLCGFDIMCPHILAYYQAEITMQSYREIKAIITPYIAKSDFSGQYFCRICGEILMQFDSPETNFGDETTIFQDDLRRSIWGEAMQFLKYVKLENVVDPGRLINNIRDICYPFLRDLEQQILYSKTSEETKARRKLYISVYVFAYFIHLCASTKYMISLRELPPNAQIAQMILYGANLISSIRNVVLREIPGANTEIVKIRIIEAYKNINEKMREEKGLIKSDNFIMTNEKMDADLSKRIREFIISLCLNPTIRYMNFGQMMGVIFSATSHDANFRRQINMCRDFSVFSRGGRTLNKVPFNARLTHFLGAPIEELFSTDIVASTKNAKTYAKNMEVLEGKKLFNMIRNPVPLFKRKEAEIEKRFSNFVGAKTKNDSNKMRDTNDSNKMRDINDLNKMRDTNDWNKMRDTNDWNKMRGINDWNKMRGTNEGSDMVRQLESLYIARAFDIFATLFEQQSNLGPIYIVIFSTDKYHSDNDFTVKYSSQYEARLNKYLGLLPLEMRLLFYRDFIGLQGQTSLKFDKSLHFHFEELTIARLYDEEGRPHNFNIYVFDDEPPTEITDVGCAKLIEEGKRGPIHTAKIVNKKCSTCGILLSEVGKLNIDVIDKVLARLTKMQNLFKFYENRCPEGGIHQINSDTLVCVKCGLAQNTQTDNKLRFDYYEKYYDTFERDNMESASALAELSLNETAKEANDQSEVKNNIQWFPSGPKENGLITRYIDSEKLLDVYKSYVNNWQFNYNRILEFASQFNINQNLLNALGATGNQEWTQIESGNFIAPETESRFDTRIYILESYLSNFATEYNQLRNYAKFYKPPFELEHLVTDSAVPKVLFSSLPDLMPEFAIQVGKKNELINLYPTQIEFVFKRSRKPREIVEFLTQIICEMGIKIAAEGSDDTVTLRKNFVLYYIKKIIGESKAVAKPGYFKWALLYPKGEFTGNEDIEAAADIGEGEPGESYEAEVDDDKEEAEKLDDDYGDTDEPLKNKFDMDVDEDDEDGGNQIRAGENYGLD